MSFSRDRYVIIVEDQKKQYMQILVQLTIYKREGPRPGVFRENARFEYSGYSGGVFSWVRKETFFLTHDDERAPAAAASGEGGLTELY